MPAERELERLVVRVLADPAPFLAGMRQVQSATLQTVRVLGSVTAPFLGIGGLFKGIELAAQAEQMEALFGTLLGGADKGHALNQQLIELARNLPVSLASLQAGARQMLSLGVAGNQVIPTLMAVANVAGGMPDRMNILIRALAHVEGQGHLTSYTLRSMVFQGFNPLLEISRTTGRSMQQLEKDMHAGKVTADMVTGAFKTAGQQGGIAFGLLATMSQTTAGLWSRLTNTVQSFLRTVGAAAIESLGLNEVLKGTITALQSATAWFDRQPESVKKFIFQVGAAALAVGAFTLLWPVLSSVVSAAVATVLLPFSLLLGVMRLLHIQQLIGYALWLAWVAVWIPLAAATLVLAAAWAVFKFVLALNLIAVAAMIIKYAFLVALFVLSLPVLVAYYAVLVIGKAVMWLWNAAVTVGTFLMALFTGGVSLATAGTWLWNAALVVANALLAALTAGITLVLAVVAGLAVVAAAAGAFVVLGAAAMAAWRTLTHFFDLFAGAAQVRGAVEHFATLFREWWGILKQIVNVAKNDLGAAWDAAKLAFSLMVSEIRDAWPPLWQLVRDGWEVVSAYSWGVFKDEFYKAFDEIVEAVKRAAPTFSDVMKGIFKPDTPEEAARKKQWEQLLRGAGPTAEETAKKLQEILGKGLDIKDSEQTKNLKKQLDDLFGWNAVTSGMMKEQQSADLGGKQGRAYVGAIEKEVKRLDAVLSGSTAAFVRQEDFYNLISGGRGGGYAQAGGRGLEQRGQGLRSGSGEALGVQEKQLGKLGAIAEGINQLNQKPGVNIRVGGLLR